MSFKSALLAAVAAITFALPAAAGGDIMVMDPYARAASASAKSGAAFMMIHNHGTTDDRLIGAASPAAKRVELHTHVEEDGVMRMIHVEEGFALPADGMIMMQRGGQHVMFMGLTEPFEQGKMVPVTLIFETAGEIEIEVPVDLTRKAEGMDHDHSMEKSE